MPGPCCWPHFRQRRTFAFPLSGESMAVSTPPRSAKKDSSASDVARFMQEIERRNPGEPEFHQAVREVAESVMPIVLSDKRYRDGKILERMAEPDRVISFRVCWE